MMESPVTNSPDDHFGKEVNKKAKRKVKALRETRGVWFGLGMMGIVGWSIAVPTLLGAALGVWLDNSHPQPFSWTLTFLVGGILGGGIIAWYWVQKEDNEIHKNDETDE